MSLWRIRILIGTPKLKYENKVKTLKREDFKKLRCIHIPDSSRHKIKTGHYQSHKKYFTVLLPHIYLEAFYREYLKTDQSLEVKKSKIMSAKK